jgi:exodeoxyribonuclease VII small subunit
MTVVKKSKLPDLENSLNELNSLIEQMEHSELSLEQSLAHFERGIILIKHSQSILQDAEQKVQLLMKKNNEETLTDYENNNE